jgi:hypothetical protein
MGGLPNGDGIKIKGLLFIVHLGSSSVSTPPYNRMQSFRAVVVASQVGFVTVSSGSAAGNSGRATYDRAGIESR